MWLRNYMNEESIKKEQEVVSIIGQHPEGLSLMEIVILTGMTRQTIMKYLDVAVARGTIEKRVRRITYVVVKKSAEVVSN